jgi:hypothetical protein
MAMAGSAVGAVLFIWAIGALLGGDHVPSVRGAAHDALLVTRAPSSPPATGRIQVRGGSTASPSASSSVLATTSAAVTATTGAGSGQSTTTKPTTTTTTTPAAPQACPDSVLTVTAMSTRPVIQVGDHPELILRIGNAGPVPCVRDVSRQFRSVSILAADGTPLWSSRNCYTVTTHEIRTLQPNQTLTYSVVWAGRTDAPGCPAHRTTVRPGRYQVVGALGSITGPATELTIT